MERDELVLAALAAGGENASFTPVQVQKLFFLIDREAAAHVGGPHFDFEPYDYGPFDHAVYAVLGHLETQGLVQSIALGKYRVYSLTPDGYHAGSRDLSMLSEDALNYIRQAATWVRRLSFQQLVAAIYIKYPEMKVNSVFRG